MKPVYDKDGIVLYLGDCRDVLPGLQEKSFQIITDPPYESEAHTIHRHVKRGTSLGGDVINSEPIPFDPMDAELRDFIGKEFSRLASRWILTFCQIEGMHIWRDVYEKYGLIYKRTCLWCLSGGTKVYANVPDGHVSMSLKDIVRSYKPCDVKLWNGAKWTQVKGWIKKERPKYVIGLTLRSGERINCTAEHLWPTERGIIRADELSTGDVLATTTLPEQGESLAQAFDNAEFGWFAGIYLAEGNRGAGSLISLALHKDETSIVKKVKALAERFGGNCGVYESSENGITVHLYSEILYTFLGMFIGGRVSKDKHLLNSCWRQSNMFLKGLLDGYLEGDGHYDAGNRRWRLGFARNYELEDSIRTVGARLGIPIRLRPASFRGEVLLEKGAHGNSKDEGEIVDISLGKGSIFWDIEVEDEPHLFALSSGVLTHNCKPDAMPQYTGDRPGTGYETILAMHAQHKGKSRWNGGGKHGVFVVNKNETGGKPAWHPTAKPLKLMTLLTTLFTDEGETVLDPFFGGGSMARAAKDCGRKFVGIEKNEKYVEIAINRLAQEVLF